MIVLFSPFFSVVRKLVEMLRQQRSPDEQASYWESTRCHGSNKVKDAPCSRKGSRTFSSNTPAVANAPATWLIVSSSTHHATGNCDLLSSIETVDDLKINTGDGVPMPVRGCGSVITDTVVLADVLFVPNLKWNIVSVSQLAQLGCSIVFKRDACYISAATDGNTIGKAIVEENGMFKLEFLKVPLVK